MHDDNIINESGLNVLFGQRIFPVHTDLQEASAFASKRWLLTAYSIRHMVVREGITGENRYCYSTVRIVAKPN